MTAGAAVAAPGIARSSSSTVCLRLWRSRSRRKIRMAGSIPEEVDVAEVQVRLHHRVAHMAGRAVEPLLRQLIDQGLDAGAELRPAAAKDRQDALLQGEIDRPIRA